MLEHYFVKPATVDRIRANVAGAYIEHYVSLASISPPPLAAFLVERCAGLARRTRRDLCGTLRIFLRYCHRERIIRRDLCAAVEVPRLHRLASVPRAITW